MVRPARGLRVRGSGRRRCPPIPAQTGGGALYRPVDPDFVVATGFGHSRSRPDEGRTSGGLRASHPVLVEIALVSVLQQLVTKDLFSRPFYRSHR